MPVELKPLQNDDYDSFISDNQEAFRYGAMEEFGLVDDHCEEDGEIISRATIETSIANGEAYRIWLDGEKVGGVIVRVEDTVGELEILFIHPKYHNRHVGYKSWCAVEEMYPQVEKWKTCTPYFEKRNIHFYVNRCGFHIVEFACKSHPMDGQYEDDDEMFFFEKVMKK